MVAAHSAGKNYKAEGGGEAFDLKNVKLVHKNENFFGFDFEFFRGTSDFCLK
jgi:hypothetical protein